MESKMFTLALVMLFCVVQQSSSLKCISCSTNTNPKCADVKDKGFQLQECTVENVLSLGSNFFSQFGLGGNNANANANKGSLIPTCLKTITKNGTISVVDRRCSVRYQNEDPCVGHPIGGNNPTEFCKACEQDGCNSGNSMQLFSSLIVFGAIVCTARLFV